MTLLRPRRWASRSASVMELFTQLEGTLKLDSHESQVRHRSASPRLTP